MNVIVIPGRSRKSDRDRVKRDRQRQREQARQQREERSRGISERIGDISDRIAEIPGQLSLPTAVEKVPESLQALPAALEKLPQQIEKLPKQLDRVPRELRRIPRRIDEIRHPKRKGPSPILGLGVLAALGLGMVVAWFFDKTRGAERRSIVRDRARNLFRRTSTSGRSGFEDVSYELRDREEPFVTEVGSPGDSGLGARAGFGSGLDTMDTMDAGLGASTDDEVLVERVRSQMGRVVSQASRIDVTASGGQVTVSGTIPAGELDSLLSEVAQVPGVRGVENRLDVEGSTQDASEAWNPSGTTI